MCERRDDGPRSFHGGPTTSSHEVRSASHDGGIVYFLRELHGFIIALLCAGRQVCLFWILGAGDNSDSCSGRGKGHELYDPCTTTYLDTNDLPGALLEATQPNKIYFMTDWSVYLATVPQPRPRQMQQGRLSSHDSENPTAPRTAICHRAGHEPVGAGLRGPVDGDGAPKDRFFRVEFAPCVSGPGLTTSRLHPPLYCGLQRRR